MVLPRQHGRYLQDNAPKWLARVTVREGERLRRRFWQPGGGYDRNITSTEALRAVIDYIHAQTLSRSRWANGRASVGLLCHARNIQGSQHAFQSDKTVAVSQKLLGFALVDRAIGTQTNPPMPGRVRGLKESLVGQ